MYTFKRQPIGIHNNLGFTLIEVMIVFIIISITVTLVVPNFNKILGNYQLDISAREMASDIRDIQQTAIKTQNSQLSIIWDINHDIYYLMNGNNATKVVQLPSSVDLTSAPLIEYYSVNKKIFATSGRPLGGYYGTTVGFGGTITFMDKNTGKNKYVIIDTLGRVRVSETPS